MLAHNKVIAIRNKAIEDYHKTLEDNLQPILEKVVKDLQKLYPSRNIYMLFGNGGCVVNFESKNRRSFVTDYYGNLQSYSECVYNEVLLSFPDNHPLVILMKVLDELYNVLNYVPALNDIK